MYIVVEAVKALYTSVEDAGLVHDEGEWYGGQVLDSTDAAGRAAGSAWRWCAGAASRGSR
jgi:hypothetical protein